MFDSFGKSLNGNFMHECGAILETKLQCPQGHVIRGEHSLFDRLPLVHMIKMVMGNKKTVSPECRKKYDLRRDFRIVLIYGEKLTINEQS